ncbi:DUF397 domain-containing protein [Streptomyces canus]|uniref:DUF397 domain-containing protein n=1 Tax=Streptomyces canus TaxID=58343 RepID=UPI002250C0BE|nr:DUF397 domain-containing protein [Streptomyces canus]MCX4859840.1 DUF397 domain-containing protein [Streptomyces canus]WSW34944.1 DUF397 domain-containing protein [Streptomyces canus]
MQTLQWKKSTYSGDSSNCLEIAATPGAIHVRDSKTTGSPHLVFPSSAWVAFISHTPSNSDSRHSAGR